MPIPLALPLLTSLAGGVIGAIGSGKNNNKAKNAIIDSYNQNQALMQQRFGQLENWYNRNNVNYLDSAEARAAYNNMYQGLVNSNMELSDYGRVTGATNESTLLQRQAGTNSLADLMQGLASSGTQYRQNVESNYMNMLNNLQTQQMDLNANKANSLAQIYQGQGKNWTQVGQNFGQAGMGLASLGAGAGLDSWLKGLFAKKG